MDVRTPIISPSQISNRRKAQIGSTRTPTEGINCLNINDDKEERRQRRRSVILSNNDPDIDLERNHIGMTYAQLKEHNANCVKLSSENKINSKNAFALHLIDYMKLLVRPSQKEDSTTNFQVASCTLDAGVKIYAGRVDSVHADAYKILGSLGRATVVQSGEEENDNANEENSNKQQKKKTNKLGKTIEKNIKALNCDKFDLTFEVDPFFHKTSATFDEGGTGGLLLNHLLIKDESYELMLDSTKEIAMPTANSNHTDESDLINLASFRDISSKLFKEGLEVCPQFADFEFTEWDRNAENLISGRNDRTQLGDENHRFDMNAPVLETENDAMDADGASYMSDDDGDTGMANETFQNNLVEPKALFDGEEAVDMVGGNARVFGDGFAYGPLQLELSIQPNDYSYFRQDTLNIWAGPQHWKLKPRSKDYYQNGVENGDKAKKKRQKKDAFNFNYDSDSNIQQLSDPGKVSKTLAKSTLDKLSAHSQMLPEDLKYDADNFFRFFIKSSIKLRRKAIQTTNYGDNTIGSDFDGADGYPVLQDGDDDDDDNDSHGLANDAPGFSIDMNGNSSVNMTCQGFDDTVGEQTFFGGENLVSQPNKVEKLQISYAKTAKRIDIKKLKRAMWETITVEEGTGDKENISQNIIEEEQQETVNPKKKRILTEMQSFKDVYDSLPNKISQSASKNLSVPIAFVCMLYLANEKELKLVGKEDMTDFSITTDLVDT